MGLDSPWHILIVIVVLVLLFGSAKLPKAAKSLGEAMRIFKAETQKLHDDTTQHQAVTQQQVAAPQVPVAAQAPLLTQQAPVAAQGPLLTQQAPVQQAPAPPLAADAAPPPPVGNQPG